MFFSFLKALIFIRNYNIFLYLRWVEMGPFKSINLKTMKTKTFN